MLNYDYFHHGCTRNIITIFGALFSEIYIKRHIDTGDDKSEYQEIKIPITYSPKQRTLTKILQKPNIDDRETQITLPRMSFEIVSLSYDPARKINPSSVSKKMLDDQGNTSYASQMHSPTPYNIHLNLYAYAKNQTDALQIVEQIFPFFNPDLNVTINTIPVMGVKEDIPIVLDAVSYEDDYEGDQETRRAIIWTLSFTAKMNYYGPITKTGVIKRVNVNVGDDETRPEKTALKYRANVSPLDASITDPYVVVEEFLYGE
jgi:hypothetical protein